MKNAIYNYYNFLVDDINKYGDNYYINFNGNNYLLYLVLNDINEVKNNYEYLINNKIDCYKIIVNKDNNLFSLIDNKNYVLLELSGIIKYELSIYDFKYIPVNDRESNWGKLWSDRLDYYEIQIRELGIKYQTVLNSFGFFSGLAENAILYYNLSLKMFVNEDKYIGLVHNRIKYPTYLIDYNNPVNYVVDYSVRDIAEYIKFYLLSDEYEFNNVLYIIDNYKFNNLMFNIFYARLLYPTFYFDIFDKILLDNLDDEDIVPILNVSNKYLDLLKRIYLRYKDVYHMFKIDWLLK